MMLKMILISTIHLIAKFDKYKTEHKNKEINNENSLRWHQTHL